MLVFLAVKLVLESHLAKTKGGATANLSGRVQGAGEHRPNMHSASAEKHVGLVRRRVLLPGGGSELGPLPGVNQAVDAETVVEVAVELSALPAAKRVVVHSAVEMQALAVLRRPRVLPAVVQVVRAQGRNVPVGQLVHQSQGALPARGP